MNRWRSNANTLSIDSSTNANIKVNGNTSNCNQKRGAERLFQYFEADDSDPEDYSR